MEGNGESSAALLLYAAALGYARWQQAYSAGFKAFTADELDQAVRAGEEARAQLRERAAAFDNLIPAPWKLLAHEARSNNQQRMKTDSGLDRVPSGVFYWLALAGEVGEACNLVKKLWRDGPRWTSHQVIENGEAVREELCDVRIYTEALADLYGMDLDAECEKKMRRVMQRPFAQPVKA